MSPRSGTVLEQPRARERRQVRSSVAGRDSRRSQRERLRRATDNGLALEGIPVRPGLAAVLNAPRRKPLWCTSCPRSGSQLLINGIVFTVQSAVWRPPSQADEGMDGLPWSGNVQRSKALVIRRSVDARTLRPSLSGARESDGWSVPTRNWAFRRSRCREGDEAGEPRALALRQPDSQRRHFRMRTEGLR